MKPIENISIYTERMESGMQDKLFFLDHLNPKITTVLDFGCADGSLGKAISKIRPDLIYFGYDENNIMLNMARENYREGTYFDSFSYAIECVNSNNTILILSSVLHELYSYKNRNDIEEFWKEVRSSHFKQIAIRDMGLSNSIITNCLAPAPAANMISSYIMERYGRMVKINNFADYYQLFLKYWYSDNWSRESRENFFALTIEELESIAEEDEIYTIKYKKCYILPYIKNKVIEDFGVDPFITNTHYQMILNRKESK